MRLTSSARATALTSASGSDAVENARVDEIATDKGLRGASSGAPVRAAGARSPPRCASGRAASATAVPPPMPPMPPMPPIIRAAAGSSRASSRNCRPLSRAASASRCAVPGTLTARGGGAGGTARGVGVRSSIACASATPAWPSIAA
ncbi:MAG: hypothetical protein MUC68_02180 [Burkholderiaceae bacterium]|nr:hypothetical protein [Burkholderiaceae bacterium]